MNSGLTYNLGAVLKWCVPLTWVLIATQAANAIDAVLLLRFAAVAPGLDDQAQIMAMAEAVDQRTMFLAGVLLTALFACYIANGIWIYRASWNAREMAGGLGNAGKRITPGWAVGWYFVPFANLVMPFTAMQETWTASHRVARAPGLLGWWWAAWVVASLLGTLSGRMAESAEVIEDFWNVGLAQLGFTSLHIVAAFLFLHIIRQVTAAQSQSGREAVFA